MEITKYGKSISLIFLVGYQFLRWPTSADPKKSEKQSASTPILFICLTLKSTSLQEQMALQFVFTCNESCHFCYNVSSNHYLFCVTLT